MRHQHLLRAWPKCVPLLATDPQSSKPGVVSLFEFTRHERTLKIEGAHSDSRASNTFGRLDQGALGLLINRPRLHLRVEARGFSTHRVPAARGADVTSSWMEWNLWAPPVSEEVRAMK